MPLVYTVRVHDTTLSQANISTILTDTLSYVSPHINASRDVFPQIETHRVWGHDLTFLLSSRRSVDWYSRYSYQSAHLSQERISYILDNDYWVKCRKLMPKDALIFDLGSNEGYLSCMFALYSGPKSRVIAVEPLSKNIAISRANTALNHLENQIVHMRAAVTERGGEKCWIGLREHVQRDGEHFAESVPTVTIDELTEHFGMPDVIKMDIEGFEVAATRSAQTVLAAGTTIWVIELHENEQVDVKDLGYSMKELSDRLTYAGYTLFCDAHNNAVPLCSGADGQAYAVPTRMLGTNITRFPTFAEDRPPEL